MLGFVGQLGWGRHWRLTQNRACSVMRAAPAPIPIDKEVGSHGNDVTLTAHGWHPKRGDGRGPHVADGCSGAAADRQTGLARDRGNTPTRTRQRKDQRARHRARLIAVLPDSEATSAKEGARHLLGSPDADTP